MNFILYSFGWCSFFHRIRKATVSCYHFTQYSYIGISNWFRTAKTCLFLFSPLSLIDAVLGLNMLQLTVDSCVGFFSSILEITVCLSERLLHATPTAQLLGTKAHQKKLRNSGCQIIQFKKKKVQNINCKTMTFSSGSEKVIFIPGK